MLLSVHAGPFQAEFAALCDAIPAIAETQALHHAVVHGRRTHCPGPRAPRAAAADPLAGGPTSSRWTCAAREVTDCRHARMVYIRDNDECEAIKAVCIAWFAKCYAT